MVLLALATIVHGLVTSVRRHRRDLAVLKTLGLRSGQVVRVVLCQATTIALIALAVGIPIGIVAGNLAWRVYSERLGVVPETAVSAVLVGMMIPVVLVTANLAAALPGRMAARVRPATVLRSE
jgi:ABC-type lipoprotein release transport system permease subunit